MIDFVNMKIQVLTIMFLAGTIFTELADLANANGLLLEGDLANGAALDLAEDNGALLAADGEYLAGDEEALLNGSASLGGPNVRT